MIRLMYFLLPLLHFVAANEEINLFTFKFDNETVHGVVDMDADANWISHHIFATKNLKFNPVTIARDHNKNIEVFKFDHINACLVRRIPKTVRAVWGFKAMLEIEEEHNFEGIPRVRLDEYLSCTKAQVRLDLLGNVGYLCRHLKVYWLKQTKPMHTSGAGEKNKVSSSSRQRRAASGSGLCGPCTAFCGVCCSAPRLQKSRTKREILAAKMCTRNVYVMNCPPK